MATMETSKNLIVVLACTCDASNRKMVDANWIKKIGGRNVILVNVARGALVVENDICNALSNGDLAFYATDVCESEPVDPHGNLCREEKVFITPHIGGVTVDSYQTMARIVAQYAAKIIKGGEKIGSDDVVHVVN